MLDEDIDGGAQRRVGGDARIAVRAAALQSQHQLGGRHRLALRPVGDRQHHLQRLDAGGDRLLGAARLLDRERPEDVTLGDAVGLLHATDLEAFAAESDDQNRRHVRIAGIAPGGALQHLEALAVVVDAAARAVGQRDHPVDIGIVGEQAGALDLLGHEARGRGRAVHRGQDADIVARAGLAIGAAEALEGRLLLHGQHEFRLGLGGIGIVALEGVEAGIVFVHPVARHDVGRGEADDLAELADRLILRDRGDRHLVPTRDALQRLDAGGGHANVHRIDGDDDIVGGVELERSRRRGFVEHGEPKIPLTAAYGVPPRDALNRTCFQSVQKTPRPCACRKGRPPGRVSALRS